MPLFENFDDVIFDALGDDVVHVESGEILRAVLDNEYYEAFEHATRSPMLTIEDPVIVIARGDTISHASKLYKVVNTEPDGTGITVLQLALL